MSHIVIVSWQEHVLIPSHWILSHSRLLCRQNHSQNPNVVSITLTHISKSENNGSYLMCFEPTCSPGHRDLSHCTHCCPLLLHVYHLDSRCRWRKPAKFLKADEKSISYNSTLVFIIEVTHVKNSNGTKKAMYSKRCSLSPFPLPKSHHVGSFGDNLEFFHIRRALLF